MVHDPKINQSLFLQLIKNINQQLNLSILLITHEMDVIKEIADCVAVLDQGQIIEQGNTNEILYNPNTQYTKNLVSTISN